MFSDSIQAYQRLKNMPKRSQIFSSPKLHYPFGITDPNKNSLRCRVVNKYGNLFLISVEFFDEGKC